MGRGPVLSLLVCWAWHMVWGRWGGVVIDNLAVKMVWGGLVWGGVENLVWGCAHCQRYDSVCQLAARVAWLADEGQQSASSCFDASGFDVLRGNHRG
jgi:hypothetical protein